MKDDQANYFFLTAAVFCICVQVLLAVILLGDQFPVSSQLYQTVVLEWMPMISPERELVYFRFFVVLAAALQTAALIRYRHRLNDGEFHSALKYFLGIELLLTLYLLVFAIGIALNGLEGVLRQPLFYIVVAFAVVHKFSYRDIRRYLQVCCSAMSKLGGRP